MRFGPSFGIHYCPEAWHTKGDTVYYGLTDQLPLLVSACASSSLSVKNVTRFGIYYNCFVKRVITILDHSAELRPTRVGFNHRLIPRHGASNLFVWHVAVSEFPCLCAYLEKNMMHLNHLVSRYWYPLNPCGFCRTKGHIPMRNRLRKVVIHRVAQIR